MCAKSTLTFNLQLDSFRVPTHLRFIFFFTLIHHFHNMSFNSGQACYVSVCYYVDLFFKQEKEKNHVIYQIFKRLTDLTIVTVAKGIGAPGLQNIFPPCLKMYLKICILKRLMSYYVVNVESINVKILLD